MTNIELESIKNDLISDCGSPLAIKEDELYLGVDDEIMKELKIFLESEKEEFDLKWHTKKLTNLLSYESETEGDFSADEKQVYNFLRE
jgi:hypothetical protein